MSDLYNLQLMFDNEKNRIIILGVMYFMSTSLKFELLIIRNKNSSPDDFNLLYSAVPVFFC